MHDVGYGYGYGYFQNESRIQAMDTVEGGLIEMSSYLISTYSLLRLSNVI